MAPSTDPIAPGALIAATDPSPPRSMPDPPRVSVIVPSYNYARYLSEAIESLRAQSFLPWECIVVDDGSTDGTRELVQAQAQVDPRIRYVHQENHGLASARNTGLALARGEFIQFLDADDRLAPSKLAAHVSFLDAHPETDIVYTEVAFFRDEDPSRLYASMHGQLSRPIMARVQGNREAMERLEHYNIMPVLAALLRRSVLSRAGVFDVSAASHEDWGFWMRCAVAGCEFRHMEAPEPLATVRVHATSLSRDPRRMLDGLLQIARAFPASDAARSWTNARRLPLIYEVALGIDAVCSGRRLAGARRIWRAARAATQPLTALRWYVYAVAAVLPRPLYRKVITLPVPERPFELYRRAQSLLSSSRTRHGSAR